ncbi:hypothetical protein INR49_011779 [Caranx melampygus]|nr:hypothetical protein INR49_011779 [Caranx melampygus]
MSLRKAGAAIPAVAVTGRGRTGADDGVVRFLLRLTQSSVRLVVTRQAAMVFNFFPLKILIPAAQQISDKSKQLPPSPLQTPFLPTTTHMTSHHFYAGNVARSGVASAAVTRDNFSEEEKRAEGEINETAPCIFCSKNLPTLPSSYLATESEDIPSCIEMGSDQPCMATLERRPILGPACNRRGHRCLRKKLRPVRILGFVFSLVAVSAVSFSALTWSSDGLSEPVLPQKSLHQSAPHRTLLFTQHQRDPNVSADMPIAMKSTADSNKSQGSTHQTFLPLQRGAKEQWPSTCLA